MAAVHNGRKALLKTLDVEFSGGLPVEASPSQGKASPRLSAEEGLDARISCPKAWAGIS